MQIKTINLNFSKIVVDLHHLDKAIGNKAVDEVPTPI